MSSGIVDILTVVAADKSEKVQRRAAAALGELMFYISDKDPSAGGFSAKLADLCFHSKSAHLRTQC